MSLTGKVLMTCDLAVRYGIRDVDGNSSIQIFRLLCHFADVIICHYTINIGVKQVILHTF